MVSVQNLRERLIRIGDWSHVALAIIVGLSNHLRAARFHLLGLLASLGCSYRLVVTAPGVAGYRIGNFRGAGVAQGQRFATGSLGRLWRHPDGHIRISYPDLL